MRLWIKLIYTKQHKSLETYLGRHDEGCVRVKRWEWGVGKGQWKRLVNAAVRDADMRGRVYTRYFIIGSRYTGTLSGTSAQADALFSAI